MTSKGNNMELTFTVQNPAKKQGYLKYGETEIDLIAPLIVTTANLDGKIKKAREIVKAAPESSVRLKEQELFKQVRNFYSYQPDKKIKSRFQYIKKLVSKVMADPDSAPNETMENVARQATVKEHHLTDQSVPIKVR